MTEKNLESIKININTHNKEFKNMTPEEIISWGYENFNKQFAITTSFGIQSSVILKMLH